MPNGLAGSAQVSYPLVAPSGTAGAPSFSFAASPTSGLYLSGANAIGVSTAGTARWQFSGPGHLLAETDNVYDIGANGATRPRTVYAATSFRTDGSYFTAGGLYHTSLGSLVWTADGIVRLTDNAGTSFGRLCFGGTSSAFPALRRSGAGLDLVVADGTAWAILNAQAISIQATGTFSLGGNVYMDAASDGVLRLRDAAATSFGRLCFGGTAVTDPSIKRDGANLALVPADGSAGYIDLTVHDLIGSSVYLSNIVAVGANNTNFVLGGSGITAGLVNSAASFIIQVTGGAVLATFAGTGYLEMTEVTAPSAPAANSGRLYFEDNGAGKTRLMCLFASGSAQQLAIEP